MRTKNWTTIVLRKESFYVFQRTKINRIRSISPNKFRFRNNTYFGISNEKTIIWIAAENMVKRERKQLSRFANPSEHPRNSPLDVKLDAIRSCSEHGENIKYVSEDIGYSRASIY